MHFLRSRIRGCENLLQIAEFLRRFQVGSFIQTTCLSRSLIAATVAYQRKPSSAHNSRLLDSPPAKAMCFPSG